MEAREQSQRSTAGRDDSRRTERAVADEQFAVSKSLSEDGRIGSIGDAQESWSCGLDWQNDGLRSVAKPSCSPATGFEPKSAARMR